MANYYAGRTSFRQKRASEDTDPMASLANIADVMLVFACGLMASLIIAWNVDLSQFTQVEVGEEQLIDEPEAIDELSQGGGTNYIERGTVYMDAETGQYYLVEPTDSGSSNALQGFDDTAAFPEDSFDATFDEDVVMPIDDDTTGEDSLPSE